jgi:YidC/Oxa1 family membrane protein insertase
MIGLIFVHKVFKSVEYFKPLDLEWNLKAHRNEKIISYEISIQIYYEHKDGKVDYAGLGASENELLEKTNIYSFQTAFFLLY